MLVRERRGILRDRKGMGRERKLLEDLRACEFEKGEEKRERWKVKKKWKKGEKSRCKRRVKKSRNKGDEREGRGNTASDGDDLRRV